ncbi:MAG: DUF4351 domain-containing protein [Caldilineaceae bacterium]
MSISHDDYDSPWKNALEDYFEEFMGFFFPDAHDDIDWSRPVEFLDKELQQVALEAETGRRYADKLAKVWRKSGEEGWVLAHVEIQGQPEEQFNRRVYTYNHRLFDRDDLLVASFAVLTDDNDTWRPGKFSYALWGCKINFEFPTIKLADYRNRWDELERDSNPFALVAMAHLKTRETRNDPDHRKFWKYRLIRHLYDRGYGRQDILNLFRFIDWMMQLPDDLEREWMEQVEQMEAERHMQYVTSVERFAIDKGRKEEAVRLLLRLLTHRFGEVSASLQTRFQTLTIEQIEPLVDVVLTASSLPEFSEHLPNAPEESVTSE